MASGEMSAPALRPEGRAVKGDTLIRRDRDPAMPSTFSIADWKKLVKEHPEAAGADAVPKALESYSKAEAKDDPEGILDALKTMITKAEAAKKSVKKKEVVGYLEKMIKE